MSFRHIAPLRIARCRPTPTRPPQAHILLEPARTEKKLVTANVKREARLLACLIEDCFTALGTPKIGREESRRGKQPMPGIKPDRFMSSATFTRHGHCGGIARPRDLR